MPYLRLPKKRSTEMRLFFEPTKKIVVEGVPLDLFSFQLSELHAYEDKFWKTLSTEEQERALRFIPIKKKEEFILCRGLLRHLLFQYTDLPAQEVPISYSKHLKPITENLPAAKQLFFNLSHSEDRVVYIFNHRFPVGIDIERANPIKDLDSLAKQICTPREYLAFESTPHREKLRFFYDAWVKKEACLKALGIGLHTELRQFPAGTFPDPADRGKILSLNDDLQLLDNSYIGALALSFNQ